MKSRLFCLFLLITFLPIYTMAGMATAMNLQNQLGLYSTINSTTITTGSSLLSPLDVLNFSSKINLKSNGSEGSISNILITSQHPNNRNFWETKNVHDTPNELSKIIPY